MSQTESSPKVPWNRHRLCVIGNNSESKSRLLSLLRRQAQVSGPESIKRRTEAQKSSPAGIEITQHGEGSESNMDISTVDCPTVTESIPRSEWERNDKATCSRQRKPDGQPCNTTFNLWFRRHHCRRCGVLCCDACSPFRMYVSAGSKVKERVCTLCAGVLATKDRNKSLNIDLKLPHPPSVQKSPSARKPNSSHHEKEHDDMKTENKMETMELCKAEDPIDFRSDSKGTSLKLDVVDVSGREGYSIMHRIVIQRPGVYLLLLSLDEWRSNKSAARQHLRFWLQSLDTYALGASFAIVGTHRVDFLSKSSDQVGRYLLSVSNEIGKMIRLVNPKLLEDLALCMSPYSSKELNLFPINCSGSSNPCIHELYKKIYLSARTDCLEGDSVPLVEQLIPLEWIKVFGILHEKQDNKFAMSVSDIEAIGGEYGMDEDETERMLERFHNLGLMIYNKESELRDFAIISPQKLVSLLKTVIWDARLETSSAAKLFESDDLQEEWEKFRDDGYFTDNLLRILWKDRIGNDVLYNFVVKILEKYLLICSCSASCNKFIIPSMLQGLTEDSKLVCSQFPHGFSIVFERYVSPNFFDFLLAKMLDLYKKYGSFEIKRLSRHSARLVATKNDIPIDLYVCGPKRMASVSVDVFVKSPAAFPEVIEDTMAAAKSALEWPMRRQSKYSLLIHKPESVTYLKKHALQTRNIADAKERKEGKAQPPVDAGIDYGNFVQMNDQELAEWLKKKKGVFGLRKRTIDLLEREGIDGSSLLEMTPDRLQKVLKKEARVRRIMAVVERMKKERPPRVSKNLCTQTPLMVIQTPGESRDTDRQKKPKMVKLGNTGMKIRAKKSGRARRHGMDTLVEIQQLHEKIQGLEYQLLYGETESARRIAKLEDELEKMRSEEEKKRIEDREKIAQLQANLDSSKGHEAASWLFSGAMEVL